MINLSQGATNSIYITPGSTAAENGIVFYLFTFSSEFGPGNNYYIFPTVIDSNPRYIEFGIDCTHITADPLAGQVNFNPMGTYSYQIDVVSVLSITAISIDTMLIDKATVSSCNGTSIYNFIPSL